MRLRFAPSPTGFIHIGNVRTAVYNYLISRKYNADFVLRIEDTDMERSSRESEASIIRDLKWMGIKWTEGPDIGGDCGPYRQSERFDIYREYTNKLIAEGKAYLCYCTQEELEATRKEATETNEQIVYSGRCRNLSAEQKKKFEAEGRKPSVRFRIPDNEVIVVKDLIKGKVEFTSDNIGGDFIIVRSDGVPVYNYLVVIDDALMMITHVIRGEDHLSNTPKQMLIARALDIASPEYIHHGLVLGPDRSKLSKRHGITSVTTYRDEGYLPEALVNYLAILGWASKTGEEIFSVDEISEQIDLEELSSSPAVFDFQKLKWMNGIYIRKHPLHELTDLFIPYIEKAGFRLKGIDRAWLESVIEILRGYCDILSDIKKLAGMFMDDVFLPDESADELLKEEDSGKNIKAAYEFIASGKADSDTFLKDLTDYVKEKTSLKAKKLFMPLRAMLTGRTKGPELVIAVPVIGMDKCRKRIEYMYKRYVEGNQA